ncbi:N-6 DNA methylase [Flavobacterium sedimenticola]|uniref:site-specific DNA-methyltransferase (adenine-specific) n=1 Tax=Flavobacterium sedimenticola TaxID=3043286 RepID=A0ABT6XS77_9FLAO|nr:N-6 DNA methylase [Flavobacterium sedimenticola]MDI9257948.1 N-6 DNA methylase [Flavobacterium sedimenticola]
MNNLAQFYTHDNFSKLLLSKILAKNPKRVLEIGVGGGSLVRAAKKKWKHSDIIGGDIDSMNVSTLKEEFPSIKLFVINGLSSHLREDLKLELGSVDVAICNPPYMTIKKSDEYGKILEESLLGCLDSYSQLTSDIIFLAQNLLLLKEGGELGIIVPDGLLTCQRFSIFREKLLSNYKLTGVIELPSKIFKKTEAKTHILIIRKSVCSSLSLPIYLANENGTIASKILVKKSALIYRMDYKYHSWKKNSNQKTSNSLLDLNVDIMRGSRSKKQLESLQINYLHTTDLKNEYCECEFPLHKTIDYLRYAEEGDLLMSRVGKRCIGKLMYVIKGNIPISDCIYRIRIPFEHRAKVISSLNSKIGKEWINAHSHGVCAKVISKRDLLNYQVTY